MNRWHLGSIRSAKMLGEWRREPLGALCVALVQIDNALSIGVHQGEQK